MDAAGHATVPLGLFSQLLPRRVALCTVSDPSCRDARVDPLAVSRRSRTPWVNTVIMYLFPYFESPTTWLHQHIIG